MRPGFVSWGCGGSPGLPTKRGTLTIGHRRVAHQKWAYASRASGRPRVKWLMPTVEARYRRAGSPQLTISSRIRIHEEKVADRKYTEKGSNKSSLRLTHGKSRTG